MDREAVCRLDAIDASSHRWEVLARSLHSCDACRIKQDHRAAIHVSGVPLVLCDHTQAVVFFCPVLTPDTRGAPRPRQSPQSRGRSVALCRIRRPRARTLAGSTRVGRATRNCVVASTTTNNLHDFLQPMRASGLFLIIPRPMVVATMLLLLQRACCIAL